MDLLGGFEEERKRLMAKLIELPFDNPECNNIRHRLLRVQSEISYIQKSMQNPPSGDSSTTTKNPSTQLIAASTTTTTTSTTSVSSSSQMVLCKPVSDNHDSDFDSDFELDAKKTKVDEADMEVFLGDQSKNPLKVGQFMKASANCISYQELSNREKKLKHLLNKVSLSQSLKIEYSVELAEVQSLLKKKGKQPDSAATDLSHYIRMVEGEQFGVTMQHLTHANSIKKCNANNLRRVLVCSNSVHLKANESKDVSGLCDRGLFTFFFFS